MDAVALADYFAIRTLRGRAVQEAGIPIEWDSERTTVNEVYGDMHLIRFDVRSFRLPVQR